MLNKNLPIYFMFIMSLFVIPKVCRAFNNDTTQARNGITIAYRTNLDELQTDLHIGVRLGFERYLFQNEKYNAVGLVSLIIQRKPDIYTSAGIITGHAIRRVYGIGVFIDHELDIGYLGSYYDFNMYKTNSDGAIVDIGRTWMSSVVLGYSVGLGYDFSRLFKTDINLFIKPSYYLRIPNNDNVFLFNNYCIEAGVTIYPKWAKLKRIN